jgi:hypothetical protein
MPTEIGKRILTDAAYKSLVSAVEKMLEAARKAGRDAERSLAKIYWEMGDVLTVAGIGGRDHYGESIIEQLADDLEVNAQNIRRALVFRRMYDRENLYRTVSNLTWSHFRSLIQVHDDDARRYYEDQAVKGGWSRDRLLAAIVGHEYEREILNKPAGPTILERPKDAAYVFRAKVLEVADADTLVCDIDCGFQIKKKERIRLAELNTPEIETRKGKEAAHFVRDVLAKARGIVIKTKRVDAHGRFIGHVFYSYNDDEVATVYEHGVYLSEELLKKGLAERM